MSNFKCNESNLQSVDEEILDSMENELLCRKNPKE